MFGRVRRKAKVMSMDEKLNEELKEQADGAVIEEATEKFDKTDVEAVAGGTGTKDYNQAPELPEIP